MSGCSDYLFVVGLRCSGITIYPPHGTRIDRNDDQGTSVRTGGTRHVANRCTVGQSWIWSLRLQITAPSASDATKHEFNSLATATKPSPDALERSIAYPHIVCCWSLGESRPSNRHKHQSIEADGNIPVSRSVSSRDAPARMGRFWFVFGAREARLGRVVHLQ
ncbi:hypothetical protein BDN67DRAFT_370018 [Paxillus ammoniavirescens]|nr:hypothetical protein BDN67DRAFT_370018 [Paxillus ammoniavirescens]